MKPKYVVTVEWFKNFDNDGYGHLTFKNKKRAYSVAKLARKLKKGVRASVYKYTEY